LSKIRLELQLLLQSDVFFWVSPKFSVRKELKNIVRMKKTSRLVSILVLAAVLLAACASEGTQVPGTNVPPLTVEVTETMEATEIPTQAGTATEPGVPVTGDVNSARLSNQLDFNVWDQNGEQIGEVNDMIVDLDNTRIAYVIVGVGGFLEIGEKDVLVPWESLQLQTGTGETTGGEQNAFIYQGDQERFNNAPDFDVDELLPERNTVAGDWDSDIRNYWESGTLPPTPAPEATNDPNLTATASPEATAMPEATALPEGSGIQGEDLQGVILASELLDSGITVNAQASGAIGATALPEATAEATAPATDPAPLPEDVNATIDDVIVDVNTGEIRYIVLSAGFDDGEHWIPVPVNFFQWNAENGTLILNTDPVTLRDAPSFQNGQYPDATTAGWDSDFGAFWQNVTPGTNP
jgi:sporulation protein YlmC with PRC-barrel domain